MAQYGLQGSITQIGVVTSGVPTSIQRQILATHKEPLGLRVTSYELRDKDEGERRAINHFVLLLYFVTRNS
jgi:hypothetical protein